MILSDDFEDESTIDLLDTFRIYLFTHIAHKQIFLVFDSNKHWRYKDGCPTIFRFEKQNSGHDKSQQNDLKPQNRKDLQRLYS